MLKIKCILLILFFSSVLPLFGQISEGGFPLDLPELKAVNIKERVVKMPSFDIAGERQKSLATEEEKTVKFAHSFNVSLNPENSGEWFVNNNYRIWQLKVASNDAFALGLIFTKYHLPQGARLFIFDDNKETIYGAYTEQNNKSFNKLAIYPFPSDHLTVQYEEPLDASFRGELELGRINHDYLGVILKNRWKKRPSESCNIDVNCETGSGLDKQKRAVCRIWADDELGTATLLNNTAEDGSPILISAYHIYDKPETAEITVYDFNYESPYCTGIDGYDLQTISGSKALASFDSLDFMLVKLSEELPAWYRPYFAGWDATGAVPSDSYVIHHPNGDVMKISHDTGRCDSLTFAGSYTKYGHWKVLNWETGSTEAGSSGAGLFSDKRVFGTLSGGVASCDNPSYDAFARLSKMWDYRQSSDHQIKVWLDPLGTGKRKLDGFDPFEADNANCTVISNYTIDDKLSTVNEQITNHDVTEIAERFTQTTNATLAGVALGIKDFVARSMDTMISIVIYSGDSQPEYAEKMYKISMNKLTSNAMNYFSFGDGFETTGNFFIGIELNSKDSITFFQSKPRGVLSLNSMLIKENEEWKYLSEINPEGQGSSVLMQVNVCGAAYTTQAVDTIDEPRYMKFYPNPVTSYLVVEFINREANNELSLYDLTGRLIYDECYQNRSYTELDLSKINPGIYIISLNSDNGQESHRLMIK